MKNIDGFLGTTGHATKYDGLTYGEIFEHFVRNKVMEKSYAKYLQAFGNKLSKKLKVPSIRCMVSNADGAIGRFQCSGTGRKRNNARILLDDMNDICEDFFTVPHEVKHVEQFYTLHKFLEHGIIPNDNFGKAILLWQVLEDLEEDNQKVLEDDDDIEYDAYYSEIDELDAFLFARAEIRGLMLKYKIFDNFDFQIYYRDANFKYLSNLKYNKQGVSTPNIATAIKDYKRRLHCAICGKYGEAVKDAVLAITAGGFSIEKAYEVLTDQLDEIVDEVVLEDMFFKSKGAKKLNLSRNGMLQYGDNFSNDDEEVVDEFGISEQSEHAEYIKKYLCRGQDQYQQIRDGAESELCK